MKGLTRTHILLFILTLITMTVAGALNSGVNLWEDPWGITEGLAFSLTLITILMSHEMGHYVASRHHRTDVTPPYFIPAPPLIGTFGAFIKMRSPILTRRALVDIGAAGPIVGFAVAVAATIAGLKHSEVILTPPVIGPDDFGLGPSLIFMALTRLVIGHVPDNAMLTLHPSAFAGWIGMFVTTLNLIPAGQLDGGHIAFATLGPRRHRLAGIAMIATLAVLGLLFWEGWAIWAVLLVVLKIQHPPVIFEEAPLDPRRKAVAWAALAIFVLTFTPAPFIMPG